jgi:hypothetical protein
MTIVKQNSAFKVKMGTVKSLDGLIPERGALVFSLADNAVFLGDGFNWLTFEPSSFGAAVTGTSFDNAMLAATPVLSADYFDAILYNLGSAMTISIPAQTVTIDIDGDYRINWLFNVQCDVPNVGLHFDISLNGTPVGHFDVFLSTKNTPVSAGGTATIPGLVDTDVLTLDIETDKACNLTRFAQEVGYTKI